MIGVDYELFWTLNPKSLQPFIKAFELRQEYDDACAWQSGIYIRMAIASSFDKNTKYPIEPFSVSEKRRIERSRPDVIKRIVEQRAEIINMRFENKEV